MAKVTLILEDGMEPDGSPGLTISYDADMEDDGNSIAHSYASALVEHIVGNAKRGIVMDKEGREVDKIGNQEDPNLN